MLNEKINLPDDFYGITLKLQKKMTPKEKRIALPVKLLWENYIKVKKESEKLWLTMSWFISMLISTYISTEIKSENRK